ncbi:MAG: sulfate adenylyltransferase [Acidobacteria bacterium]|nr:MAG: sulfate adenylyltransferase [Acidobacteriota bacterium]
MSGLLRLCTAGSVDDGKSTLIGRLLYESRGVYEDQVRSVEAASRNRGAGPIDFSLFTDGLKAEREQGITIDVAYRYFATARRKFILADTPGHEQYTRNMATGASTSDLAILLVDARHGIREQTRRHARIARLLGISSFVLAVNKMDLVGFDRDPFERMRGEFRALLEDLPPSGGRTAAMTLHAIPLSALHGDNVTTKSARTPWYDGPALLPYLETVEAGRALAVGAFRLPVQLVLRPDHRFRGYAGQIASGVIRAGDAVTIWPSGMRSRVTRIVTWDGDLETAFAPMSIALVLDHDVDISRGDFIATTPLHVGKRFSADVVWMDERPLDPERPYVLKHSARSVTAEIDGALALNQIGRVQVATARPLAFDPYAENRITGSFVLIDPATNFTAGAGMIADAVGDPRSAEVAAGVAARLARAARDAATDRAAVDAVRDLLEEILT